MKREIVVSLCLVLFIIGCGQVDSAELSDEELEQQLDGLSEDELDAALAGSDEEKQALTGKGWLDNVRIRIPLNCGETDEGNDLPNYGVLTQRYRYSNSNREYTRTRRDSCRDGRIKEYYCDGAQYRYPTVNCPQGETCQDNECVPVEACECDSPYESCVDNECVQTCRDFDGGQVYHIGSQVNFDNQGYIDSCITAEGYGPNGDTASHLIEYYCENGERQSETVECEHLCYDGDGFGRCVVEGFDENVPDSDGDGLVDDTIQVDNCPFVANPTQNDEDNDGIGDACDICRREAAPENVGHHDGDHDSVGNMCDNCINVYNPFQEDDNGNGIGDLCE
ncbi:MAG: hypothetical protein CMH61_02330 [Nanoarchaeota archaeon]|nr:hypothetical protein [Nanoarchaeota archaeon]|tara:strand:- start:496 stop:1506 length:1011 start_codon:yes stop_codon:yes gene_type:complete